MTIEEITKVVSKSGFKLTPQRRDVVKVLLANEEDHMSAEEIYHFVKKENKDIGLATVYRTLELLEHLKIVERVSFSDDGVVLYDLKKPGSRHFHHHLYCIECGNVQEIEEDLLLDIEKDIQERFKFIVTDHRLTFHGVCSECQARNVQKIFDAIK
jgi:Fur family ferric uptake transcriptional regulator